MTKASRVSRRDLLALGPGLSALLAGCAMGQGGWRLGDRLPDIAMQDSAGRATRISDFDDRAVLFYIGARWCVHCRADMPALAQVWRDLHADRRIVFAALAYYEDGAVTRGWINRDIGIGLPVYDQGARSPRVQLANGGHTSFAVPAVYILAPGNIIHYTHVGSGKSAQYRPKLLEAAALVA